MTHIDEESHSSVRRSRLSGSFFAHQALASWGVIVAAPWILIFLGEIGQRLGLRGPIPRVQWLLYGTPYFPAHILIAFPLGWLLGGSLRHRSMLWVWILPLIVLCAAIVGYPQTVTVSYRVLVMLIGPYPLQDFVRSEPAGAGLTAALWHFFGWGHGFQPCGQLLVTVPFYTSAAYSLGAMLAWRIPHTYPFFEGMRRLRVWRLALCVGLPWFLMRGIQLWEQAASRLPFYRTVVGILAFLGALLIWSAFVTLVLAVALALVGPRFAFTRFFIREGSW